MSEADIEAIKPFIPNMVTEIRSMVAAWKTGDQEGMFDSIEAFEEILEDIDRVCPTQRRNSK